MIPTPTDAFILEFTVDGAKKLLADVTDGKLYQYFVSFEKRFPVVRRILVEVRKYLPIIIWILAWADSNHPQPRLKNYLRSL